jgi:hypothetical protein
MAALALCACARGATTQPDASTVRSTGLQIGVTAGGLAPIPSARAAARLGAKSVRIEFPIGASPSQLRPVVAAYARHDIALLPLAGFPGRMPTAAEARSVAAWAREFGPGGRFWAGRSDALAFRAIEFGNESSYVGSGIDDQGAVYAERVRQAYVALQRRGGTRRVGLLVQGDDGNTSSGRWLDTLFDAVPSLNAMAAGWTIHPYGPWWRDRLERLVGHIRARTGSDSTPIYITEWGLATDAGRCLSDNYGWNRCMSSASAARRLRATVSEMRRTFAGRLRGIYVYQATDQRAPGTTSNREAYFGVLRHDLGTKGAYTSAVRSLLARSPAPGR